MVIWYRIIAKQLENIGGIMLKVHGILILFKVYIYSSYYLGIKLKQVGIGKFNS